MESMIGFATVAITVIGFLVVINYARKIALYGYNLEGPREFFVKMAWIAGVYAACYTIISWLLYPKHELLGAMNHPQMRPLVLPGLLILMLLAHGQRERASGRLTSDE